MTVTPDVHTTATDKPATILGTNAGPYVITAATDDELIIRVDGIDFTITLPAGAAVTPAAVIANVV